MVYLSIFTFPDEDMEFDFFMSSFFDCQFIISTHSPFLLAMNGAKIYDLDENPVDVKRWTELENVRMYYNFFKEYDREF